MTATGSGFTPAELERSRRYHRPLYTALVVDLALSLGTLALLTRLDLPLRWWLGALVIPAVVDIAATAVTCRSPGGATGATSPGA